MAHFRLFSCDGEAVAINVDLVTMIRTKENGNADVYFVGSQKPQEFAMSARDLHNALINPHINLD